MTTKNRKALVFCIKQAHKNSLRSFLQSFFIDVTEKDQMVEVAKTLKFNDFDLLLIDEDTGKEVELKNELLNLEGLTTTVFLVKMNKSFFSLEQLHPKHNFDGKEIKLNYCKSGERSIIYDQFLNANALSILNHEIFTPLNSVLGFARLLESMSFSEQDVKKYAYFINQSGEDLYKKSKMILELIALKIGAVELNRSYFFISKLLDRILKGALEKNRNRSVAIHLHSSDFCKDTLLYSDAKKIEVILESLLDNALKFTEKGKIFFGVYRKDLNEIEFYVKDTGVGIPTGYEQDMFEVFSQAGDVNTRKQGGLGIGLCLVKELLNLLEGTVKIESQRGKGTTIWIKLPVKNPIDQLTARELNLCDF